MSTIPANTLTLQEVHQHFQLQRAYVSTYAERLTLEPITDYEQQELQQTREELDAHLATGLVSEGQAKLLSLGPLLRLAKFYHRPLQIRAEEGIAKIQVPDGDRVITGRLDILAINPMQLTADGEPFWVLVIESKGSAISPTAGLPQLLTYAYSRLQAQSALWGLVSNGEYYRFVHFQAGELPCYELLPSLALTDEVAAVQILQVLKAIRLAQVQGIKLLSVAG